ncbi:oxidoreductase [Aureococcus anophagefferens]|nr:oxidoreductase [Aureococcus anophagefferens]
MPLAQESMDPRPDPARQPANYPDPARQPANYMSAVARRNIDAPSAAVIAEETAASEKQLEEHRKRRITTTHFDWQLDLGPCEGLRRDLARVAGMIFRTLWQLVTFTLYMEGMFILLRLIERVRRRREKSGGAAAPPMRGVDGPHLDAWFGPRVDRTLVPPLPGGKKNAMAYKALGPFEVSVASLGGANWTRELLGYSHQSVEERELLVFDMLDVAYARGVNLFDLSECYPAKDNDGRAETLFGRWLREREIARGSVVISTKVVGPGGDKVLPHRYDALGTPPGDRPSFEIHWPARYVPKFGESGARFNPDLAVSCPSFDEQLDAIEALLEAGKIAAWGVSNETTFGLTTFLERAKARNMPGPASIQNDYSLCDRRFETELAEACHHGDVGLLVFGAMCGGTLSGKYNRGRMPRDEARHREMPGYQARCTCAATLRAAEEYADLAAAHGLSPAHLALAWCYSRSFVASTILGARHVAQLEDQLDALAAAAKVTPALDVDHAHRPQPAPPTHGRTRPKKRRNPRARARTARRSARRLGQVMINTASKKLHAVTVQCGLARMVRLVIDGFPPSTSQEDATALFESAVAQLDDEDRRGCRVHYFAPGKAGTKLGDRPGLLYVTCPERCEDAFAEKLRLRCELPPAPAEPTPAEAAAAPPAPPGARAAAPLRDGRRPAARRRQDAPRKNPLLDYMKTHGSLFRRYAAAPGGKKKGAAKKGGDAKKGEKKGKKTPLAKPGEATKKKATPLTKKGPGAPKPTGEAKKKGKPTPLTKPAGGS